MRKFAAHYLLTDTGLLLKNGMVVAHDNKSIQFIDTKGELTEIERMIFHSGLLMGAYEFIKSNGAISESLDAENPLLVFHSLFNKKIITLNEIIDLAKHLQDQFPKMNVPQLLNKADQALQSQAFVKKTIPGLYLLSGLDLEKVRFTAKTRLKKVI